MNYLELFCNIQYFNYYKQFHKAKINYEKYNYLIPKNDIYLQNKFLNEYEISCKKFILESKPTNLQIVLFNKCSSDCIMCNQEKKEYFLSEKYIKEISKSYLQYLDTILWQGGEIFLYDKFVSIINLISKYKKINQQIVTNAQFLNKTTIKDLVNMHNLKLIISIDSSKKEIYEQIRKGSSFLKLIENISLINKYKEKFKSNIELNINFVILKENYTEIADMVNFAKKYKFAAINFNEYIPTKNYNFTFTKKEKKHIKKLLEIAIISAKKSNIRITVQSEKNNFFSKINKNIMICKKPWNKLLLENDNFFAPECTCLKKQKYLTKEYPTIEKMWNSNLMQSYRKHILKIKNNDIICNSSCRLYKHYYFN